LTSLTRLFLLFLFLFHVPGIPLTLLFKYLEPSVVGPVPFYYSRFQKKSQLAYH
jgi:hypothetical protein